jgi:crotonobetainyl-CoA:carnitine CoA-transferase CaiB-like acyl-CoA transferase
VKFSTFEVDVRRPPRMGEHTDEVLAWCGYSETERDALRSKGVI